MKTLSVLLLACLLVQASLAEERQSSEERQSAEDRQTVERATPRTGVKKETTETVSSSSSTKTKEKTNVKVKQPKVVAETVRVKERPAVKQQVVEKVKETNSQVVQEQVSRPAVIQRPQFVHNQLVQQHQLMHQQHQLMHQQLLHQHLHVPQLFHKQLFHEVGVPQNHIDMIPMSSGLYAVAVDDPRGHHLCYLGVGSQIQLVPQEVGGVQQFLLPATDLLAHRQTKVHLGSPSGHLVLTDNMVNGHLLRGFQGWDEAGQVVVPVSGSGSQMRVEPTVHRVQSFASAGNTFAYATA